MELEYNGEKRQFLYHHSSGKCPHCNYSIPVSESLVPWGTEVDVAQLHGMVCGSEHVLGVEVAPVAEV